MILTTQLRTLLVAGAIAAVGSSVANADSIYINPNLPGTVAVAEWEMGSLSMTGPLGAPTSSNGFSAVALNPIAPGYRATAGFYSWGGDFGAKLTATTEGIAQTVFFQLVMMQNPDFTTADSLNYNGGPILSYYIGDTKYDLSPVNAQLVNGPVFASVGPFEGDLYSFGWEWDLSSVASGVTSFEISAPIIVHSSTVEARLDVQVQAVPEPSTYAMILGGVVLAGVCIQRRRNSK